MSKNKKRGTNFLVQGSVLAIASIISRIIGLVYRIPLIGIIGDKGMDYYSTAFDIYNILLIISSFSLPLAVSKLVSADMSLGRKRNVSRVLKCSLIFSLISGTAAALVLMFGADYIAGTLLKTPYSIFAVKVLIPTLIIVAVLGVLRGFFQGLGSMMPSAVSQILEQIVNAIVSVWAAYALVSYGAKIGAVLGNADNYSAAYGAAGGTIGTGAGALIALLFSGFVLFAYMKVHNRQAKREKNPKVDSYQYIFKILIITILPILLSTTIYNCNGLIDRGIFKNIAHYQGYGANEVSEWYGIYSGKFKTLVNVPISIAAAIASSCVPALTRVYTQGKMEEVKNQIHTSIRFTMLIAFPCTVGMGVLAAPILQLVHFSDESGMAAKMLIFGAVSVIFYSLSSLSNGLLQGINRLKEPVKNAAVALVVDILVLVALMLCFDLGIYAEVIAFIVFGLVMCVLNALSIRKYSGYKQEMKRTFVIPGIASVLMGAAVFGLYRLLILIFRVNAIAVIVSILFGALLYAVLLLVLKGLTETELKRLPKGELLISLAKKLHLLA